MKIGFFFPRASSTKGIVSVLSVISLSASFAGEGNWVKPYADGSNADKILNFGNGAVGKATAPLPGLAPGIHYSAIPAGTDGGGWSLRVSGSVGNWAGTTKVASAQGTTSAGGGQSIFGLDLTSSTNLSGASFPMVWSSSGLIDGSDTWSNSGNEYRYNFNISLNSTALIVLSSFYDDVQLRIDAGSETLYNVTGLAEILGIESVTVSGYTASVPFDYDQSDGPLTITWGISKETVGDSFLKFLSGSPALFSVSAGSIETIPEPSTYGLVGAGLVGLTLLRSRRYCAQ